MIVTPCSEHNDHPAWRRLSPDEVDMLDLEALPSNHRILRGEGEVQVERRCTEHRHHADDWFEDPGSGKDTPEGRARRRARDACFVDCPMKMRLECLNLGMQPENLAHGIWGGYTEKQRQEMHTLIQERRRGRVD